MNWLGILLGIGIGLGSLASNIPQLYNIIKYKNVEGISEASLILMNLSMACLTMNSLIFNWNNFFCLPNCFEEIFPFLTISLSWIVVLIYYIVFVIYKFHNYERCFISALNYAITYILFLILMIGLALGEKLEENNKFFHLYAQILGVCSAFFNGFVYIPQIYLLLKNGKNGNLSLLTYLIQTPGNLLIIIYQAIIFLQPWTIWITYLVCLVEQSIILIVMIYNNIYSEEKEEEENKKFNKLMEMNEEW